MSTTHYQTNEIALTLPAEEFLDSTLNAIRLPSLDASLVISRGAMPDGATLESVIDEQIQKLGSQVQDLHYAPRQVLKIGAGHDLTALELRSRFTRGKETLHQYQVAFVVPGTRLLMALTYTRSSALTQADAEHWETIKKGLSPLQRT
ncbi:DUF1795 domain-containing protein [Paraburkholderia sp. LEh10]|uniref:DcrB-related protein n=1 Tax=Paraburkholderia sp. LEh10 TaxID=2821353 RepID=UPI001AE0EA1F|nr:DcrB-related protein [Paraburkholderia sp. LEh10]MBP0593855.1 DUF1795 domain-containing protein [Paraburkholderia sp. LEh10]